MTSKPLTPKEREAEQDYFQPDDDACSQCCGEGIIMLSEAGPDEWGEDTFCEIDREIACPSCKGDGLQTNRLKGE